MAKRYSTVKKRPYAYVPPGAFRPRWFWRMSPELQERVLKSQKRSWRWLTKDYAGLNAQQHRGFFAARQSMLDGIDYVWDLLRFTGISKRRVDAYEKNLERIYAELAEATRPQKFGGRPRAHVLKRLRQHAAWRRHVARTVARSARGRKRGK